jgi:ubiquitin-protein ligase
MAGLARQRLAEERKDFRKNKPFGFSAKPKKKSDGCALDFARTSAKHAVPSGGTSAHFAGKGKIDIKCDVVSSQVRLCMICALRALRLAIFSVMKPL